MISLKKIDIKKSEVVQGLIIGSLPLAVQAFERAGQVFFF